MFNIFIHNLDEEVEEILIKFAGLTKLERVAKTEVREDRDQDELDRLENWAIANKVNLNKHKCKLLHLSK